MIEMHEKDQLSDMLIFWNDFVEERLQSGMTKLHLVEKYKTEEKEYFKLYDKISITIGEEKVDEYISKIFNMHKMENTYIYLRGLVDGINLGGEFKCFEKK